MSKYTAEQVERYRARLLVDKPEAAAINAMLRDYAALLCERESAQPVAWLDMGKGEAQLIFSKKGDSNRASRKQAAHLFETVEEGYHPLYLHAPMLASARVPEEIVVVDEVGRIEFDSTGQLDVNWSIEGGPNGVGAGAILLVADRRITNDEGYGEVYIVAPKP